MPCVVVGGEGGGVRRGLHRRLPLLLLLLVMVVVDEGKVRRQKLYHPLTKLENRFKWRVAAWLGRARQASEEEGKLDAGTASDANLGCWLCGLCSAFQNVPPAIQTTNQATPNQPTHFVVEHCI